jgi:hypothetical protein
VLLVLPAIAAGAVLITSVVVLLPAGAQPVAPTEYVTEYVPAVEEDNVITPVPGLIDSPAVELYVPPVVKPAPGIGVGSIPFEQTGLE